MDFGTAISTCFSKYADFQGRARRSEYWYFVLFNFLVIIGLAVAGGIVGAVFGFGGIGAGSGTLILIIVLVGLYWLGMLIPNIAVQVRRFHDLGVTGWFVLIFALLGAIPYIGWLISIGEFVWFCQRGTVGENKYGLDPYAPDPSEVFL